MNKEFLKSKRVSHHLKTKNFDTYILQVVLYGLDSVNWMTNSLQKLATYHNQIMRLMTKKRLSDYISTNKLHKITKLKPIT